MLTHEEAMQVIANIEETRDKILDLLAEERTNARVACVAMAQIQGRVLQGEFADLDTEDILIIRKGIDLYLGDLGKG